MKTIEQIGHDIEERQEQLMEAYEAARRRGGLVPVRPEELSKLAELCSRQLPTVRPAQPCRPTPVPEYAWIRC